MKVFMSWSGQRSKLTAELLYGWVKCVIQAAQPWISSKGIERGALWFSEINNELKDTAVGIICLTQENKNAPWILFEAGALAKGLSSNRVCTLLVDLKPADLQPPLAQFNHTFPDKESMWSLVTTLNNNLVTGGLELPILERVFETYWPQFEASFAAILEQNPPNTVVEPRKDKDLLTEILETTRSISHRVSKLEDQNAGRVSLPGQRRFGPTGVNQDPSLSELKKDNFASSLELAINEIKSGVGLQKTVHNLRLTYGFSEKAAKDVIDLALALLKAEKDNP